MVLEGTTGARITVAHSRKVAPAVARGKLDDRQLKSKPRERNFPSFEIISNQGVEEMDVNIKTCCPTSSASAQEAEMKVNEAFEYLTRKKSNA